MAVSTIFTDSFIQSATGLDANGSKSVWQFIEKFRANPAHPSLSLERVKEAASKNVWSGRVGRDLRAILYQEDDNWLILYVGHHDDAYGWAASRQIERHVKTGQLQVVELPTVTPISDGLSAAKKRSGLFAKHKDDYLLSLGVPPAWLSVVRAVATEDDFLDDIYPKLPGDVAERLFLLASGEMPAPPAPIGDKPSDKDSAHRWQNFYLVESDDDLRRLLAAPMAAWIAFLHPSQKRLATGAFNGPVKVTVKLNGEELGQLTATKETPTIEKEFTIPAAKLTGEFSTLTLQSDKYFVPKLVDKKATDDRKLAFSLIKLEWAAK